MIMSYFIERCPENIKELKTQSQSNDYEKRLGAVLELGRYKSYQSKEILWNLMLNDKAWIVQKEALDALKELGEYKI